MAFAKNVATFKPQGVNNYVPRMALTGDLMEGKIAKFSLGTPALADDDIIDVTAAANATAGTEDAYTTWTADSPYGRNIVVTPSGAPGGSGLITDIYGEDYLGQKMTERFTVGAAITAAQTGSKIFYRVFKSKIVTAAANAVTFKVGTGSKLGLPYKGYVMWVMENGVVITTSYTATVAILTDPQTTTTGDPRGSFTCAMTLDGIKEVVIGLLGDSSYNAAGNGGLHGIAHV